MRAPTVLRGQRASSGSAAPLRRVHPAESLLLRVRHWCGLKAPHRQWQIKIQLYITNTGKHRLKLGLPHIQLAMKRFNPARWKPPATQPGERPYKGSYQGQRVWLVPANPEGAAEPFPPPKGNFTFATHWRAPRSLAPGRTFRPRFHRGDAVFYVPRGRRRRHKHAELTVVLGIAYIDGADVIDICPPERWPAKTPAPSSELIVGDLGGLLHAPAARSRRAPVSRVEPDAS